MKRIPPFSEFVEDMKSIKSALEVIGKILYKYDFDEQNLTEEEYVNRVTEELDSTEDLKQAYDSYIKEHTR